MNYTIISHNTFSHRFNGIITVRNIVTDEIIESFEDFENITNFEDFRVIDKQSWETEFENLPSDHELIREASYANFALFKNIIIK